MQINCRCRVSTDQLNGHQSMHTTCRAIGIWSSFIHLGVSLCPTEDGYSAGVGNRESRFRLPVGSKHPMIHRSPCPDARPRAQLDRVLTLLAEVIEWGIAPTYGIQLSRWSFPFGGCALALLTPVAVQSELFSGYEFDCLGTILRC
ncbi:hypothetical protein ABW21_db0202972 [Orbilia brochopaga]|nr:hypothetical protein ABW21_db0202972 [Drechslerella brochopaga]